MDNKCRWSEQRCNNVLHIGERQHHYSGVDYISRKRWSIVYQGSPSSSLRWKGIKEEYKTSTMSGYVSRRCGYEEKWENTKDAHKLKPILWKVFHVTSPCIIAINHHLCLCNSTRCMIPLTHHYVFWPCDEALKASPPSSLASPFLLVPSRQIGSANTIAGQCWRLSLTLTQLLWDKGQQLLVSQQLPLVSSVSVHHLHGAAVQVDSHMLPVQGRLRPKSTLWLTASEFAVGGVISVKCEDGEFRPVVYMSHSMTPPERNYPIHDKEMLAIIKATEAWRHYLEATPYAFEIYTDHHNLTYFTKSQNLSKRQARWQMWMTRFNYSLIYKKGTQMHVADLLSRRSDYYISSSEDNKDQTLLNPVSIKLINVTDQTYKEHQLLIMDFHDTPVARHKGVKATFNVLRKHYTWKGMKEQIQTYIKHCQKCQQSKVSNQKTSGSLLPLPVPKGPWLNVTMVFTTIIWVWVIGVVGTITSGTIITGMVIT